ncbi:DUF6978 family protein [Staphylococcus rostri]|uniref:DUF6978 family protein n=1 Tax=Staphylococcus rostri TaxID=522262 RepID=UPI003F65C2F2
MEKSVYDSLLEKIKIFETAIIDLPLSGEQSKYNLTHDIDSSEKFKLFINKKGHRNPDNLTILLYSVNQRGNMIRFDVNGSDHANPPNYARVPTPHIHIYTDEYKNGAIAIPLSDIEDIDLANELIDSLDFFMSYTNISNKNVIINQNLL